VLRVITASGLIVRKVAGLQVGGSGPTHKRAAPLSYAVLTPLCCAVFQGFRERGQGR
jgi:hypothetical protein